MWADHAGGFAPVTPVRPHRWDALPRYGLASVVGIDGAGEITAPLDTVTVEVVPESTTAAPTTSVPAATPVRPAVPGPRSLPGTGANLVASLVTIAVGVLGVGLAAVTWSAVGPWSGARPGRRRRRGRR